MKDEEEKKGCRVVMVKLVTMATRSSQGILCVLTFSFLVINKFRHSKFKHLKFIPSCSKCFLVHFCIRNFEQIELQSMVLL